METADLYKLFIASSGVCTDTRNIVQGNIFFALKGANFNGNEFAAQALMAGCSYAVVDEEEFALNDQYILVKDVLKTLQHLAHYHRLQLAIPIIAITGSNGKTTTKELLRDVLQQRYNTFATQGNLNNHIGVPLSLLSMRQDHELAIIEMGANHQGEIAELCEIAAPDFGLITNIGRAHIEGFGGIEGVKKGKSELYVYLRKHHGKIFINTQQSVLTALAGDVSRINYSGKDNWFQVQEIKEDIFLHFNFKHAGNNYTIHTHLVGDYNLMNALAAIAIGLYFEVEEKKIAEAISAYQPENKRSQFIQTRRNKLIMDAYNANPTSVSMALQNLSRQKDAFFILGDMLELGEESAHEHEQILKMAKELNIEGVTIGKLFEAASSKYHYPHFDNNEHFAHSDLCLHLSDKTILLKASRGARFEQLLDTL